MLPWRRRMVTVSSCCCEWRALFFGLIAASCDAVVRLVGGNPSGSDQRMSLFICLVSGGSIVPGELALAASSPVCYSTTE